MGVLIDTSVLIAFERGRLDVSRYITDAGDEEFFISAITASELLHGVHRAREPAVRSRRAAFIEGILERFPVLPIDLRAARVHAQLWADLASSGRLIGPHDLWLAAQAVCEGIGIATENVREFRRVPGLVVEHWSS
ncbi:MAG: vapC [Gemmatimonadetes bacterium]|nr:vapC [Gemmatimonadota bacterium]